MIKWFRRHFRNKHFEFIYYQQKRRAWIIDNFKYIYISDNNGSWLEFHKSQKSDGLIKESSALETIAMFHSLQHMSFGEAGSNILHLFVQKKYRSDMTMVFVDEDGKSPEIIRNINNKDIRSMQIDLTKKIEKDFLFAERDEEDVETEIVRLK